MSRLFTNLTQAPELKDQLVNQNEWIDPSDFDIVEMYQSGTGDSKFTTIIAECGLVTHALLLKRKFVILGLNKSLIHEHVRVLQCARC